MLSGSREMIALTLALRCQTPISKASSSTHGARRRNSSSPCGPEISASDVEIGVSVSIADSTRSRMLLPVSLAPCSTRARFSAFGSRSIRVVPEKSCSSVMRFSRSSAASASK